MGQLYLFYFSRHIVLYRKYFKRVIKLLVLDADAEYLLMVPCTSLVRETDEMGR